MSTNAKPNDLIDALYTRNQVLAGPYMGAEDAREQHLGLVASGYAKDEANVRVAREVALIEAGERYFAEGYRLNFSPRQICGLHWSVPENALDWRIISAGHIATTEAERMLYVTRK